jgi:hypothetical protein
MMGSNGGKFRISDVLILVAATAVGCSLVEREALGAFWEIGQNSRSYYHASVAVGIAASPVLLAWTLAATVIRLRRPRPRFRLLVRQPGAIACLLISAFVPVLFAFSLVNVYRISHWRPGQAIPNQCFGSLIYRLPLVVLAAWITLWLNGRWRPEPSAIDRFGRLLGVGWIALYLFIEICTLVFW